MTIEYKDSKRIVALSTDVANTPTVNDDLITDKGWDTQGHIGMTYDATNDEVDFNCVADTTHDYALIDLQDADYINGSNISDTAFELRCGWRVDTISNASANENRATIGLYANNTSNNTAQDIFTLRFSATTGGGQALEMFAKDNAIAVGGSAEYTFTETLSAQTLYLRFNRDGNNFRIRLYSDSNYTTLVEDSGNQSVSGITGLRYFGIKNRGDTQNNGGSTTGAILPNIEIYDGISSTTNKPTNIQDNSLLVEKDVARRYWFSAESENTKTVDDDFSGADNWTDSDSTIIGVNTTTDVLDFKEKDGNFDEVSYYAITALGTDANFTLRLKLNIGTITQTGNTDSVRTLIGISSDNDIPTETARDEVGIIWRVTDTINKFYAFTADGIALPTSGTDFATTPSTTGGDGSGNYYVEIIGDSGTYTFKLFSDSTYDTLIESESITDAGITGLDNIVIRSSTLTTTNNQARGYIDDVKFYDGVTSAITPATWTMQPTLEDDFSSSAGWTQVTNTASGVSGGELIGLTNSSGTNGAGAWKDYGLVDDEKFVLRCKFQIVTQSGETGNASTLYFGISDTNGATSPFSNRDGFGISITNYALSGMLWLYPDGTTWDNADTDMSLTPTATTYYLEIARTSATSVTFKLFSDEYSTVVKTHTQTIASTLNGLRYVMFQEWRNGSSNTTKVAVDNLQIFNGVGTVN